MLLIILFAAIIITIIGIIGATILVAVVDKLVECVKTHRLNGVLVAWWLATAPPDFNRMFELQSKVYYSATR